MFTCRLAALLVATFLGLTSSSRMVSQPAPISASVATSWTQQAQAASPSSPYRHAMAYDAAAAPAVAQAAHFLGVTSALGSGFATAIGVAVDASGNVYVGDTYNRAAKKIPYSNGTYGTPVTLASVFRDPEGVAVDASGNVYVADTSNDAVAKIPYSSGAYGTPVALGSGFSQPYGVAVDASGNVYVADLGHNAVKKIPYSSGTYGTPVTLGSGFYSPLGVAVDASGNVYVGDYGHNAVKKIPYSNGTYGTPVTLGSGFYDPDGVAVDASGNVYVADYGHNAVKKIPYSGTYGTPVTLGSGFNNPTEVAVDASGSVYVADAGNSAVKKIEFSVNLGSANVATATPSTASLQFSIDTAGTLATNPAVVTQGATGLDFTPGTGSTCTGAVTVGQTCTVNVAFTPTSPGQRLGAVNLMDSSGNVLATAYISGIGTGPLATFTPGVITTMAGNGTRGYVASQDGGAATAAELGLPAGVAVDGAGNLFIADLDNNRIRKVTAATGVITTVAGNGTGGYVASQDGGPATAAELSEPSGVAVDGAGNLYIADVLNARIRKVAAATGVITTVAGNGTYGYVASQDGGAATAAELNYPSGVAVDGAGNLYIADTENNRIRKVTAATGVITTVAGNGTPGYVASQDGGAATAAELYNPFAVAVDGAGNLYIAERYNQRVRKVTAATGVITTVAGNGTAGYVQSQDGGPATAAELYYPESVAVDGAGNLYIADELNHRIRKVTAATGVITTVAGTGTVGYVASQDRGPATAAELYEPSGVAVDGAGNLYIADYGNNRIRKVTASAAPPAFNITSAGGSAPSQTVTVNNIGNAPLTFSNPSTGQNPSQSNYFTLGNSSTACPITTPNSSTGTLAPGNSCAEIISFTPGTQAGTVTGNLIFTDNSLNAAGTTQTVVEAGSATANSTAFTTVSVVSQNVPSGTASITLEFIVGYSNEQVAPTGTPTLTVNGSTTGLGAITCLAKVTHNNCTATYNTLLLTPGTYTISATQPADSTYTTASSGTATLTVTGPVSHIARNSNASSSSALVSSPPGTSKQ